MPTLGAGHGTMTCGASGFVSWGGPADCDAVECVTFFALPLVPLRVVHAYNWSDEATHQHIPIRWSSWLVLRAFLRRWLWVPVILSVAFGIAILEGVAIVSLETCAAFAAVSLLGWAKLWLLDSRTRNIRRVLGPHQFGSSDPATWTDEYLEALAGPREMYDSDTYADAVGPLLQGGWYSRAMWAARLCTAREHPARGEELTDLVLGDPQVRQALELVRRYPSLWGEVMSGEGKAA